MTKLSVGDVAPAFTLADSDGTGVSLSDYAGREVDLVLATAASAAGHAADQRHDLALWGAPEIVVR